MLPLEHSAILSTFIKLPVVIKTFILSIFEWPFTVYAANVKKQTLSGQNYWLVLFMVLQYTNAKCKKGCLIILYQ